MLKKYTSLQEDHFLENHFYRWEKYVVDTVGWLSVHGMYQIIIYDFGAHVQRMHADRESQRGGLNRNTIINASKTTTIHHTAAVSCFYCWLLFTYNNVSALVKIIVFILVIVILFKA